jgi:hypothetical protein
LEEQKLLWCRWLWCLSTISAHPCWTSEGGAAFMKMASGRESILGSVECKRRSLWSGEWRSSNSTQTLGCYLQILSVSQPHNWMFWLIWLKLQQNRRLAGLAKCWLHQEEKKQA